MRKNIIIIVMLVLSLLIMAIGYATFATELDLMGNVEIIGDWNIAITKIEPTFVSEGCNAGTPTFTDTEVSFDAKLVKPGDHITYEVTIENKGTIIAELTDSLFETDLSNSAAEISYTYTEPSKILNAGDSTTFTVDVLYNADTTEVPSIKTKKIIGYFEYDQK